jgi:pyroglutamyl-peptidase
VEDPEMTLLLTGFEPFGGDDFNPSGAIAHSLHGTELGVGKVIHGLSLPVSGPAAWQKLSRTIRQVRPRWIVATGVSGRPGLCIESTAWNEADYRIPDNAGLQPTGSRILRLSTDPGRFVCNFLYYRLLHLTDRPDHAANHRAVFLHLPATPEMRRSPQDDRFFHPLDDLRETVCGLLNQLVHGSPSN